MAPLNIAWLLQAWGLLGCGGVRLRSGHARTRPSPWSSLWIAAGTAIAQVVAWTMEAVRRGPRGILVMRALAVAVVLSGLAPAPQRPAHRRSWTGSRPCGSSSGGVDWSVLALGAHGRGRGRHAGRRVVLGIAARAPAPPGVCRATSARLESAARQPLPIPRSDLLALVRTDRSSVWRAVPMRRGMLVLAIGPGLVAIAGNLPWPTMTVLPGLVASGGALLFGVNVWCLDGRGGLWRESLPVAPSLVFAARAIVLGEFLLLASAITIALASLRAGMPAPAELTALRLHLARGDRPGRGGRDALVPAAAVRRRPALGAGHPGPGRADGRLLGAPGGEHDADRAGVLGPRPGPGLPRSRCWSPSRSWRGR